MQDVKMPEVGTASGQWIDLAHGVQIRENNYTEEAKTILTDAFLEKLASAHRELNSERLSLLWARKERQASFDRGEVPRYKNKDSEAVQSEWKVRDIPEDMKQRRVEITGPVSSAKMVINMLSVNQNGEHADMAMLDFEDAMKPSWSNVVNGVHNVIGAARQDLRLETSKKTYKLDPENMANMMVRVRGLHLDEHRIKIDGQPVSAGIFDMMICFHHTAETLLEKGKTPNYYVPKVEHYLEARWWEKLFTTIEDLHSYPIGTLRTTFLIETLHAAFQIEEILYEIRHHATGLNVGRWDKIFSDIKVLRHHEDRIMADRAEINMEKYWMDNYAKRLIKICHSRGAFAIGGMSAFTPGSTPELREEQTAKVMKDKKNENDIGHDGCWVSHPYFITPALECFPQKNQIERTLPDQDKYPDLLPQGGGPYTEAGLQTNIRVGIGYMQGWNQDIGCVAWDNLMEDLATLEISRAQTWQWLHHGIQLEDGRKVTKKLVKQLFDEELDKIHQEVEEAMPDANSEQVKAIKDRFSEAKEIAQKVFTQDELADFLHDALEDLD